MKKLSKILVSIILFLSWNSVYIFAAWETSADSKTTVVVTEQIPWMDCELDKNSWSWPESRRYECTVEWWFGSVMKMLAGFIKYMTFLAALGWVLMLVISWMRLSIEWKKDEAKTMVKNVIIALLVIFLMWFILNTVAPWVYK